MNKEEMLLEDLKAVLKEAKAMGCTEVRKFEHIQLEKLEVIVNALEKQVPIEHHHTKVYEVKDNIRLSICPNCLYSIITNQYEYPKYCTWCGQKIDWSDWSEADE